jgi:hypothetical protein
MTIQEILAQVDELTPNTYSAQRKLQWLSDLDGRLFRELIQPRAGAERFYWPEEGYDSDEQELLAPPPYGADLYLRYLQARIAAENGEIHRYAQYSALFNQAYAEFAAWYARDHMPLQRGRWRL